MNENARVAWSEEDSTQMERIQESVECNIRRAAAVRGLNLALPANAFLLAKNTPQGWQLTGYPELGAAVETARFLAGQGNTNVCVLNSVNGGVARFNRDGQIDWQ